jgi:hypothetical protein
MRPSISRFALSNQIGEKRFVVRDSLLQGHGWRWETGACMPATGRAIVFLSDFGYRSEWVGIATQ